MYTIKAIIFAILACGSFSLPTRNSDLALPDTDFNFIPMDAPFDDLDFKSIEASAAFEDTDFSLIRSRSLAEFRHQLASKTAFNGPRHTPSMSRNVRRATSVQSYDCEGYAEPTTTYHEYTPEPSVSPITSIATSPVLPGTTAGIPDSSPLPPSPIFNDPQTSTVQGAPISSVEMLPIYPTPTSTESMTTLNPENPTPSSAEQISATLSVTFNPPSSASVPPTATQPLSVSLLPTFTNAVSGPLQPTSTMPLSVSETSGPTTSQPAGEPLQPTNTKPLSMSLAITTPQATSKVLQPTTISSEM